MKAFPLAGLLRLRNTELDSAAGALAASNIRVRDAKERRARAFAGLGASESMPNTGDALMAVAAARAALRSELESLTLLEREAAADAEAAQAAFSEAKKRTVPLEKMEARHRATETAADLKAEQDALDETAVIRASGDRRRGSRRIETEEPTRKAGNASY